MTLKASLSANASALALAIVMLSSAPQASAQVTAPPGPAAAANNAAAAAADQNGSSETSAVNGAQSAPSASGNLSTPGAAPEVQAAAGPGGGANQLQEIVVTAQKRAQNLQKVPETVTAINAAALEARGLDNVVDLATSVPGLDVSDENGLVLPFLRGVGTTGAVLGNESSVGLYVDGVYFARLPAGFFELKDVDRVEVLDGPQGTLFGRNTTGGVINVITRDPTQATKFLGGIGGGNFDSFHADLYGSTALTDKLSGSFSLSGRTDNGFGKDLTTNTRYGYTDEALARGKLLYQPTDNTRILLSGFYSYSGQSGAKAAFPGTLTGTITAPHETFSSSDFGYYNTLDNNQTRHNFDLEGGSLRVEQTLPFAKLVNITAYSHLYESDHLDGDYGPRPDEYLPLEGRVDLITQEVQLVSLPSSPFDWIVGFFYYNNLSAYYQAPFIGPALFGPGLQAPAHQRAVSYAGFAQSTYEILPKLKITGGVRYTDDQTSAGGAIYLNTTPRVPIATPPNNSTGVYRVTFKGSLDYQLTDRVLTYASFSRGYKSGVYNILTYDPTPTRPEGLDAYEAGFKSDLFDRRVRINGAFFYYDEIHPQVELIQNSTIFFSNAGSAHIKGFDLEGSAVLLPGLTSRLNFEYLDAKYASYPDAPTSIPDFVNGGADPAPGIEAAGNNLPLAPKAVVDLGADYAFSNSLGRWTVTGDAYYNTGYDFEPDNFLHQGDYFLLSAQLRYQPTSHLSVRLWGKNLTDSQYASAASTQLGPAGYPWTPAPPRTYGITLDFNY